MDIFGGLDLGSNVNTFKTTTNSSMQNVRSNTLTPVDITTQSLNQGVAVKTARDTNVTSVVTNYRSTSVESLDGVVGALSGGLLNIKDLTNAIRVGKDGVTFSTDSLMAAAGGELGFNINGSSGAMRSLASSINNEFSALSGVQLGGIIQAGGDTGIRVNKNWRTVLGAQTLRTVGAMSGLGTYFDASVKAAVFNAIMDSAVEYGMSDSYQGLYDNYPASLASSRRSAMLKAIQSAMNKGDIVSLNALIIIMEANDVTVILSAYPTFIQTLFSKFTFDDTVYPTDYPALLTKLLTILNLVAGPTWWLKYTNFGYVYDVTVIHKASPDMITLLRGFDPVVPLLCCAGQFSSGSAVTVLQSSFPNAPQYDAPTTTTTPSPVNTTAVL